MDLTNRARLAEIAGKLNISRQGLTQGLARSLNPPKPVIIDRIAFYDITEVTEWWQKRCAGQAAEWKERRQPMDALPTTQLNMRVNSDEYAKLDSMRQPGETMAAAARRIFRLGLASA